MTEREIARCFREHKKRERDMVWAAIVALRKAGHRVYWRRGANLHVVDGRCCGNSTLLARARYVKPRQGVAPVALAAVDQDDVAAL